MERTAESLLTDWQKIEAINIFSLSKTNYHLRASTPYSTWARSLNKKIRQILKPHIKLSRHTTNHFLYTPNRNGGVGLWSLEDVARITQFYKCLTSPDKIVSQCAWLQLVQVVSKCTNNPDPSSDQIEAFLNTHHSTMKE